MNPRIHSRRPSAGPAAPRRWLVRGALLAALMLGLAALPSEADMNSAGGGSESVGSLPSSIGPGPGEVGSPTLRGLAFQLVLVGDEAELRALIADATGTGSWTLQRLEAPGLVRLVFQGHVELSLDRAALERSFATVSLELGPAFSGGLLGVSTGSARHLSPVGSLEIGLHLQQLSWSGLADRGVVLHALTPERQRSRLAISSTPDRIVLVQAP